MSGERRTPLSAILISVGSAAVLATAASITAVQVNSAELDRAKVDLREVEVKAELLSTEVTRLAVSRDATAEAESDRWAEIRRRLEKIETSQERILQSLPRHWRETRSSR